MFENLVTDVFDEVKKHTIKKFEIVEKYVEAWAQKLLNTEQCKAIAFIDCMSSSGLYIDDKGNQVKGTPIRVAEYISSIMPSYPDKNAWLCFNDLDERKIETLRRHLPKNADNFHISFRSKDANELLRDISGEASNYLNSNYLLLYDPYEATIDWDAINPFLQGWGEVIINHMVSDTIRSLPVVKRPKAIEKYSRTYKMDLDDLISIKGDRQEFERIITSIIFSLRTNHKRSLYISSFPFFNSCNAVVYNLIHCTGSIVGFKLFKKTAWQVFGGKSSSKKTYGSENQLMFALDNSNKIQTDVDEDCYHVQDIAAHVHKHFRGREDVPLKEVWALLDRHPIFPSEGFADPIKRLLREMYGDSIKRSSITFTDKE